MSLQVTQRRGQNATASLDDSLAPVMRREAALRGSGVHSLATEMIALVIECMQATGKSWDDYRKSLPGYDQAIAARLAKVEVR